MIGLVPETPFVTSAVIAWYGNRLPSSNYLPMYVCKYVCAYATSMQNIYLHM